MSYIIAKKLRDIGCYAFRVKDNNIGELIDYLNTKTIEKEIEIFIISSPEVYKEYEPYSFIYSKEKFINIVLNL